MTPEQIADDFRCCMIDGDRYEKLKVVIRAALRERDAAWAKAIREYYGGDVPSEGGSAEGVALRALLEEAGK